MSKPSKTDIRIVSEKLLREARAYVSRGLVDGPDDSRGTRLPVGVRHVLEDALDELLRARDFCKRGPICNGDGGEAERLWGLSAGHVLTDADVNDIRNVISDHNDEIGQNTDLFHAARVDALRTIGGDQLVKVVEARDAAATKNAIEVALAAYYAAKPKESQP